MDILQTILCAFGTFFLICFLIDWKEVLSKAKKMKFDPDWINFIIGSVLFLFVVFFVVFLAEDLWKDFSGSF